ncbi:hypothetical protein CRG98_025296 [Punica granatum]|uniref:DUF7745 domain-containing protein n=2 Tax=Punica granatum TaxID=22663 RepID=A0A2I0JDH9_PUNGR|nr:hypothetical protein CRG98_025296 [Punica granatum]
MDRPAPSLRLEAITPPRQEIMRIWRTFRSVDRTFIQDIIGDVVMLTKTPVDWIFLRTAAEFWDSQHAVFNFQGTELASTIEEHTALIQRPTPTTQGIFVPNPFVVIRSQLSTLLDIPVQEVHQELHQGWDHGVRIVWLSNWTLLHALTPSTASYQRDACHGFLLLIFGTLLLPYAPNLIDGAIAQVVLQAVGGHRCPGIVGVPLLSHLGSTLIFPGRVIRQLGGLQDIPVEANHLPYRIQWADSTSTASARFLQIREIHRQWDTSTIQRLYFPKHPTDKERALSATSAYVAQFYSQGPTSPQRSQTTPIPRATPTSVPEAESSTHAAMRAELQSIREERDRLRCELVDSRAEVTNYRELQTELARARARIATLDREMARLSATLDRVRARACGAPHP